MIALEAILVTNAIARLKHDCIHFIISHWYHEFNVFTDVKLLFY